MNDPMPWGVRLRRTVKAALPPSLLIRRLPARMKASILLSFDDGPHREITPAVLSRLAAHDVRAAFFVVGHRVERAPEVLNQIAEHGHAVGNHSYAHPNSRQPGLIDYWRDLARCQRLVQEYIGTKPRLFRPPLGRLSVASLTAPKLLGLRAVTWSLEAADWRCRTSEDAARAAHFLLANVAPRDIVLLHDDNAAVLTILDAILPALSERRVDLKQGLTWLNGSSQRD